MFVLTCSLGGVTALRNMIFSLKGHGMTRVDGGAEDANPVMPCLTAGMNDMDAILRPDPVNTFREGLCVCALSRPGVTDAVAAAPFEYGPMSLQAASRMDATYRGYGLSTPGSVWAVAECA